MNALLWDIAGLNAIVGLLWKLAATTIIAIGTLTATFKLKWPGHGALDKVIWDQVVSPTAIKVDINKSLNFIGGVVGFITNASIKRQAKLDGWVAVSGFSKLLERPLRDHWLILEYLLATALSLVFVLALQAWMRRRGQPPEIEQLCNRLELGVYFHKSGKAAPSSSGGSTALALAGSAATLVGVATGGLGFLVLGPLLVAAAQATDKARDEANKKAEAELSEERQHLLGLIDSERDDINQSQNRFLLTGIAAAVGLVLGNYAAEGLKRLFQALQASVTKHLHWPPAAEATVIVLIFAGLVWAAIFGPRLWLKGQGSNSRYAASLAFVWAAAVVAVGAVRWFHEGILPVLTR